MKHFKDHILYFLWISIICMPDTTYAHAISKKSSWQPYVGMAIGYSVLNTKNKHYQKVGIDDSYSDSSNTAKGPIEALFIGIQKKITNFMIGAEVYGFLSQQKGKVYFDVSPTDNRHESMERTGGYGLKLKGGYGLNPLAVLYLHAGIENAYFQYKGIIAFPNEQPFKKTKFLLGYPFGAGLEVDLTSKWKTRFEYTYTKYQRWKTNNLLARNIANANLSSAQQNVIFGLAYEF